MRLLYQGPLNDSQSSGSHLMILEEHTELYEPWKQLENEKTLL